MRVCALRFTEEARRRILKAGGEVMTFDELAKAEPLGKNVLLLRGNRRREAYKHWGKGAGIRKSHTKPYVLNSNHRAREYKFKHVRR